MISPKIGRCADCNKEVPLIAKRCKSCYWLYRSKVNSKKPKAVQKALNNKELGIYFANQILVSPKSCEECGASLASLKAFLPSAIVAHILPKRDRYGFPSVATHPQNRWFACGDCHTDYDNKGIEFASRMKIVPVLRERVAAFWNDLTTAEQRRVPDFLKPT